MHLKKKSLAEFATKHSKVRNPYGIMSITTTRPRPAKYVIKNFQAPIFSIITGMLTSQRILKITKNVAFKKSYFLCDFQTLLVHNIFFIYQ